MFEAIYKYLIAFSNSIIYLLIFFEAFQSFIKDTMIEAYSKEAIANIFQEVDKDNDGFITRQDLEGTDYALTLFQEYPSAINAFNLFQDGKMNLKDFTLLVHGSRCNLAGLAYAKFQFQKHIKQSLSVPAPGEAAHSVKQSYIKLKAHSAGSKEEQLHSFGVELGVDQPHQEAKIKQVAEALGHPPHQVFLLIKFSCSKNGEQIAAKLLQLVQNIFQVVKGITSEAERVLGALKPYAKYANNYVYLVIEVDNPFVDGLIQFATEVVQAISPQCAFKLKTCLKSNLSNLLNQSFDYTKSGGQVQIEFDVDHTTLKKIKQILGDLVPQQQNQTPPQKLISLLLEEVKLQTEFNNLGEAITSTLGIDPSQMPKPSNQLQFVKELNIKDTVETFSEGAPDLLQTISNSSKGEGEISLNLHDFFFKIHFNVHIEKAFELLG